MYKIFVENYKLVIFINLVILVLNRRRSWDILQSDFINGSFLIFVAVEFANLHNLNRVCLITQLDTYLFNVMYECSNFIIIHLHLFSEIRYLYPSNSDLLSIVSSTLQFQSR
mgnify:CR=1 FL=1